MKINDVINNNEQLDEAGIWQGIKNFGAQMFNPELKQAAQISQTKEKARQRVLGNIIANWNNWLASLTARGDMNMEDPITYRNQIEKWAKQNFPSAFKGGSVPVGQVVPGDVKSVGNYLAGVYSRSVTADQDAGDDAVSKQGTAGTAGTAQAGTTAKGATQAGTAQAGTAQAGTAQAGTAQAGTAPASAATKDTAQAGATQAGTAQAGATTTEFFRDSNKFQEEWNKYLAAQTAKGNPYPLAGNRILLDTLKSMWKYGGGVYAESRANRKHSLTEAVLMEDPIYRSFKSVGLLLVEKKMTEKEILDLFSQVEKGATTAGNNRTFIGKTKDVATDVAGAIGKAYQGVADKISRSAPVAGFDVAVDKLTDKLANAAGGQQGAVMTAIKKYREFAKRHPVMQGAIYAGLIALTGLSGAGLGGAALLGGIKAFDKLLLGNKASSSLWSGFLTGAAAYGLSQLQGTGSAPATSDMSGTTTASLSNTPTDYSQFSTGVANTATEYAVKSGDTLSQIAQQNNVSVQDLIQANPGITNPDVLRVGQTINIPAETSNAVYQSGVGTSADTMSKIASGQYTDSEISRKLAAKAANLKSSVDFSNLGPGRDALVEFINGNIGIATLLNGKKLPFAVFPMGGPQPHLPARAKKIVAEVNGNKVTAFVHKGKAYATNFRMESIVIKKLPLREMVDEKFTVYKWTLNESLGRRDLRPLYLNPRAIDLIFENVVRYKRVINHILKEAPNDTGPGRPDIPDELRPDMPDAKSKPQEKGFWGSAWDKIKNIGHQFTTKITADKLKMNWHVKGKPTESNELWQFLLGEGVPQAVLTDVWNQLELPIPADSNDQAGEPPADQAPADQAPAAPAAAQATTQTQTATGSVFDDPKKFRDMWETYAEAGQGLPPRVMGVLKDILKTTLGKVS